MRRIWPVAAALLLTACSQEPDFDARYDKANADIAARVKALDAAVSETEDGAAPVKLGLPVAQTAARGGASSGE